MVKCPLDPGSCRSSVCTITNLSRFQKRKYLGRDLLAGFAALNAQIFPLYFWSFVELVNVFEATVTITSKRDVNKNWRRPTTDEFYIISSENKIVWQYEHVNLAHLHSCHSRWHVKPLQAPPLDVLGIVPHTLDRASSDSHKTSRALVPINGVYASILPKLSSIYG